MRKRLSLVLASLMLTFGAYAAKDLWVIDPGHGGQDWGCKTRRSREKDITLAVAKEVGRLIKNEIPGVRIIYTRESDTYPTLPERCELANRRGAKLFLSIHVNDAPNVFAHGTESYFGNSVPRSGAQAGKSELLALLLQREYLEHGRVISRGVKQHGWFVCENTNMPCVLTEVGFISNLEEEAYITSKNGQATLARAIVDALKQWHEMTSKGPVARQKLRNLRFQYFDPRQQQPTKKAVAAAAKDNTPQTTKATGSSKTGKGTKESKSAKESSAKDDETPVTTTASTDAATDTRFFAVQICNISTKMKTTDKRLKGLTDIRLFEADGRFKVIHGRLATYEEAQKLLADVRKLFPDAFIVAFDGECQIPIDEARKKPTAKSK